MRLSEFDFDLPPDRIALHPVEPRDAARLLHVRADGFSDRIVRDLPDLLPVEELDSMLNPFGAPSIPTSATRGDGIYESLEKISGLVLRAFESRLPDSAEEGLLASFEAWGYARIITPVFECADVLDTVASELPERPEAADVAELRNLVEVGRVLVAAALARTESRGTQARLDFPDTDPAQRHRLVVGGSD